MGHFSEKGLRIQQAQRKNEVYFSAKYFFQVNANVKEIVVDYFSESGSFEGNIEKGHRTINKASGFMPLVKCPNSTCTGIGFDLSDVIREMVQRQEKMRDGILVCDDWEDLERYGAHRCLSELRYSISITYEEDKY